MRSIAKVVIRLAVLIVIITIAVPCPIAPARGVSVDSVADDKVFESSAIDGCFEPRTVSEMVNINNRGVAAKIHNENGRITIVKEMETE
jgi:hypothetical protein